MNRLILKHGFLAVVLAVAAVWTTELYPTAQVPSEPAVLTIAATTEPALRAWDGEIERMLRAGQLGLRRVREDTLVAGRSHERLGQYYRGVPVFGGEVTRQRDSQITISIFGLLYTGIEVDPTPGLSPDEAADIVRALAGPEAAPPETPTLMVLPRSGYALAYRAEVTLLADELVYFIDAHTGALLFSYSNLKRQAAVGRGTGVLGDTKKVSARSVAGTYVADDPLRPPAVLTYNMNGDPVRTLDFLNARRGLSASELAADSDNNWTDGATVDAHAYAGWVYDYYYKRFGRLGLDDRNLPIVSLVHPVRREAYAAVGRQVPAFFANAFWSPARRVMVYGVGLPAGVARQNWNYLSGSLDVVAHELTHGVTQFSSDLIYLNESGALNEAFSDIMGTGTEFFFQSPGTGSLRADYLLGEDVVTPGGIRSMEDPRAFGDPDHTGLRCCVGTDLDNGGVHINSGIVNNAFYLAIEGGTNRTSGLRVEGVGGTNREQIERVFYRAFAFLLPANANFLTARAATIRSARDLYGAGSPAERAITQAWDAVGVRPRGSVETSFWPNPVEWSGGTCSGVRPAWNFVVSVLTPGSSYTVGSWDANFYSSAGSLLSTSRLSAASFATFFRSCGPGSSRVPSDSEACSYLCVQLGGRSAGLVNFVFYGTLADGRRLDVASTRLRLVVPSGATGDAEGAFSSPSIAIPR